VRTWTLACASNGVRVRKRIGFPGEYHVAKSTKWSDVTTVGSCCAGESSVSWINGPREISGGLSLLLWGLAVLAMSIPVMTNFRDYADRLARRNRAFNKTHRQAGWYHRGGAAVFVVLGFGAIVLVPFGWPTVSSNLSPMLAQ
jgi:hypothetical protein